MVSSKQIPKPNSSVRKRLEPVVKETFPSSDFHQLGMREIAAKAGVGSTTIYRHYRSKENLLFSFINEWLARLVDRMIDHLQGIEDIKERLRKVFWVQLDFYERNPEIGKIILMTVPRQDWMGDESFQQTRLMGIFFELLKKGQENSRFDPHVRVDFHLDIVLGLVNRAFTMWIYRGRNYGLAEQANVLFELMWRGISNPKKGAAKNEGRCEKAKAASGNGHILSV